MTDLDVLRGQALGLGRAILKSCATDPDRAVARYLMEDLVGAIERELPADCPSLCDNIIVAVRLAAVLAGFAGRVLHDAEVAGVPVDVDLSSPYDSLFQLDDILPPDEQPPDE